MSGLMQRLKAISARVWIGFALCIVISSAILIHFHDRFWWPVDEGVYAYVAQRILAGDVIHRDLVDLHAGLGNYINAAAFLIFGEDLLSLRYPLVVLGIIQSGLTFWLLKDKGLWVAGLGAIAVASTGFIQFPNPGAGWYALFLTFVTITLASQADLKSTRTLLILGVLLGACFLIRQLSGVILAMGLLTWVMLKLTSQNTETPPGALAGKALAGLITTGLAIYLVSKMSITAFLGAGIWPLIIGALAVRRVNLCLNDLIRPVGVMLAGSVLVALPLVLHALVQGALIDWLRDVFITPFTIHGQDFIRDTSFAKLFLATVFYPFVEPGVNTVLSSGGWAITLLVLPVTGFWITRHVERLEPGQAPHPLLVIAAFYGVLAMHYQIPHYLFSILPVTIVAALWLKPLRPVLIVTGLITIWALYYQAAQPVSRGLDGTMTGTRVPYSERADLPRVSLLIEREDVEVFSELIERIETGASRPDEPLLTLPADPELNFMTNRRVPGWYYSVPLGVRTQDDLAATFAFMRKEAPFFVVNRIEDKYHNAMSERILEEVEAGSEDPVTIGPFNLYRYDPNPSPSGE